MAHSPHWNQPYAVCFQHLFEVAVGLDKVDLFCYSARYQLFILLLLIFLVEYLEIFCPSQSLKSHSGGKQYRMLLYATGTGMCSVYVWTNLVRV